ncbi:DUF7836 family putative zinc-binding protein [Halopiger thermotolerans]|jgi:hypothetical protein
MQRSWVPLECVECGEQWEKPPEELPTPGNEFVCDNCGTDRPISEFIKTKQGLKVLKQFYGS